ncbi:MAG: DUF4430 domain-containing protein [Clostridia bacterium]|nr:DUF4430 domain-containing protein [Clostridia bacterium]
MKRILLALIAGLIFLTGCANDNQVTVKVEIDCTEILSNYDLLDESLKDEKYVPADGKILELTEVTVKEGDGALEVLKTACKENDIHFDVSDGYAKGINYIYEKSCGEMSGWVYEVNHEMIMSEYFVSQDDVITWKYICSFE